MAELELIDAAAVQARVALELARAVPALDLAAIAAYLLRSVVHAGRNSLRIGLISVRTRVLILGGTVTDPLLRAVAIVSADLRTSRADHFLTVFVLTRCSARLANVDE